VPDHTDQSPFVATTLVNLTVRDADGIVHETIDCQIVRMYRLNDLGFWVVYRTATGTNDGQFFVSDADGQELVVRVAV